MLLGLPDLLLSTSTEEEVLENPEEVEEPVLEKAEEEEEEPEDKVLVKLGVVALVGKLCTFSPLSLSIPPLEFMLKE